MKLLYTVVFLATSITITIAHAPNNNNLAPRDPAQGRRAGISLPQLPGFSPNDPVLLRRQTASDCCEASCCPAGYTCSCPPGSYCSPSEDDPEHPCVCLGDCPDADYSSSAGVFFSSSYAPDYSSSAFAGGFTPSSSSFVLSTPSSSGSVSGGGSGGGGGVSFNTAAAGMSRGLMDWYLIVGTAITGGILVTALML